MTEVDAITPRDVTAMFLAVHTDSPDVVRLAEQLLSGLEREGFRVVPDGIPPGGGPATYVRPTQFDVTVWPEAIASGCIDAEVWKLTVEERGHGKWAVCAGARTCLDADGNRDYESIPSERTDEWLAAHRFGFREAVELARRHAPAVKMNGQTAVQILAKHNADWNNGPCQC